MKIVDVPQSDKCGIKVSQGDRYGQVVRALVIPANPRTPTQMGVRRSLATTATAWRGLTPTQRSSWTAVAKTRNSKPKLGKSGALTGCQLYPQVNASLDVVTAHLAAQFAVPGVDQRAVVMVALGVLMQEGFSFGAATWFGRRARRVETSGRTFAASGGAKA